MKETIDEFRGMELYDVIPYIIDGPYISSVPIEEGETNNSTNTKIITLNTENSIIGEGTIFYDILFFAKINNIPSRIIVNLEIQTKIQPMPSIIEQSIIHLDLSLPKKNGCLSTKNMTRWRTPTLFGSADMLKRISLLNFNTKQPTL